MDRGLANMAMTSGRDHLWGAMRDKHMQATVQCEWLDATHPSYTLYTSGTTVFMCF